MSWHVACWGTRGRWFVTGVCKRFIAYWCSAHRSCVDRVWLFNPSLSGAESSIGIPLRSSQRDKFFANGAHDVRGFALLSLLMFFMLALDRAAAADLFSVSCEGGAPPRPYFATFDIDAKTVVFETPPVSGTTSFGVNTKSGEIISATDGRIEFTVPVLPGRLDLILDRGQKTMVWPGLDDVTFRPTLIHRCRVTPPRSILSFRFDGPVEHPISVRCEDAGYMYFTMDDTSKQALFERGKEGRGYQGEVKDVSQDRITLTINFDVPRQIVWRKSRRTITIDGVDGDPNRPRTVLQCEEVPPRTMIEFYRRPQR
jgi:hypothetical protein